MSSLVQLRTVVRHGEQRGPRQVGPVLVDRQAREIRYLRVSLLDRCNYRCTYCMPPEGIEHGRRADLLTLEEIVELTSSFARWGVRRIRLTGGEPTLRKGLLWLVEQLAALPADTPSGRLEVTMTTNGERLEELAEPLAAAGLHGITVSLDALDPERFAQITRRGRVDRVVAGIDAARAAGLAPLKLNTVAIRGFNDDELAEICRFSWAREVVPRFIELMPMSAGKLFAPGELMAAADVRASVASGLGADLEADDSLGQGEGDRGFGPATYWRVRRGPFAGRRLGTIAAMTENFCGGCNRLRVSATGQVQACLARDDAGDLRGALRSGEPGHIEDVVRRVLGAKRDAHAFALDGSGGPQKSMISIGG